MGFLKYIGQQVLPDAALRRMRLYHRAWKTGRPAATSLEHLEIADCGAFTVAYRKCSADEQVISHSFANDIFLERVPEYRPRQGDVVIDVGAHIGTFSLLVASLVAPGNVFAVEPCRETFNVLKLNKALNRLANIQVENIALSDVNGYVTLHHDCANWGHSTVAKLSRRSEPVKAESLGAFMDRNSIRRCDFLRMNCEGAEFPVLLSSGVEVLKRIRVILVLYHADLYARATEASLELHLKNCGFSTRIFERRNSRGWLVASQTEATQ